MRTVVHDKLADLKERTKEAAHSVRSWLSSKYTGVANMLSIKSYFMKHQAKYLISSFFSRVSSLPSSYVSRIRGAVSGLKDKYGDIASYFSSLILQYGIYGFMITYALHTIVPLWSGYEVAVLHPSYWLAYGFAYYFAKMELPEVWSRIRNVQVGE